MCYDKNSPWGGRRAVFRLQCHMGLVSGHTLTFLKPELDCASEGIYELLPRLIKLPASLLFHCKSSADRLTLDSLSSAAVKYTHANSSSLLSQRPAASACLFLFQIPNSQKMEKWSCCCQTALKWSEVEPLARTNLSFIILWSSLVGNKGEQDNL